jgi:NADH-quinone oxidoreductase subunit M
VAALGLLLTAVFLLTLVQRVFHGPLNERWAGFADLSVKERFLAAPAILLMFVLGVWPQLAIGVVNATTTQWAALVWK